MSHSQREFQNKKMNNTLYSHNRHHSRKFAPTTPTTQLISQAKQLYQNGKLKPALIIFEEVIRFSQQFLPDVYYLCGTICLALKQYSRAQLYLRRLDKQFGDYKSKTHILLSICLHKVDRYTDALIFLNQLCDKQCPEGFLYRGKILLKRKDYQSAVHDFNALINMKKAVDISSLFLYQCFLRTNRVSQAYTGIQQFIKNTDFKLNPQNKRKCHNLLIQALILLERYDEAMTIIMQQNREGVQDSQVLFLKSEIHRIRKQQDERLLSLNECLTLKNNKKAVVSALKQLIIGSLRNRDFYQAFEYSKRSAFMNIGSKTVSNLHKLSEGLTFLMKKKFGQALMMIGSIDSQIFKSHYDHEFLKNLCLGALGYAYFSSGQHRQALKTYKKIDLDEKDDDHKQYYYNILLCEGIQHFNDQKLEDAIKVFQSATDHLIRPEPYLYISVILIQRGISTGASSDLFMQVLQIIDTGLKVGENCQMYYYRSLLYFYLGMNAEALDDVDKAIQKSQDNVARYFYLRALIFFQQRNYEQGIAECSTCLSIDEKYYDAYLQRAKMKLICDDAEEAYKDLDFHPMKQMWIPLFLLYQRNFMQIIGNKNQYEQSIVETAHFHLGQFDEAGPAGKLILALICGNYSEVTSLLDEALEINFPIGCLDIDDIYILKSFCSFKLDKFDEAMQFLNRSEQVLKKSDSGISYSQEDEKKLLSIKINGILICLKKQEKDQAYELCQTLINDVYEGSIYDQLIKLRQFIEEIKKGNVSDLEFNMFESTDLISDYFQQEQLHGGMIKFLVPMPKVRVLDIQVVPYEQPLIDFSVKQIQNKAQAPWIKKDENGVIFTTTVQKFDNLKLYTQENEDLRTSKQRIKDELQLDNDVLNKLQKLQKKTN